MLEFISELPHCAFHHVGIACEDISADESYWCALGYRAESQVFTDSLQGVRGQFMVGGGPRIELLQPEGDSSALVPWLKRRIKFYHFGYQVPVLDQAVAMLVGGGAVVAREALLSNFFKTRIAFLVLPNTALIELIEARSGQPVDPDRRNGA